MEIGEADTERFKNILGKSILAKREMIVRRYISSGL